MPERVVLYRAPTTVADADEIADWLRDRLRGGEATADAPADDASTHDAPDAPSVEVRDRFLDVHRTDDLPEQFAAARVLGPYDRETGNTMLGIVRYEERALENPDREGGVLYDGVAVQRALNAALPDDERDLDTLHVPLLDRAVGTWGDHDGRWHKRVNVLGQPALVSVPGLYEAPAKPEAYYKEKQKHALLSGGPPPREVLEDQVEGEFLVADDPRTTDALAGYVLQAVHFAATGEAFCDDEGCRLFNAHHQSEVVGAQLRGSEFCPRHAERYR